MKTQYIIIRGRPFFFTILKILFPAIGPRTVITFGRKIYVPEGQTLGLGVLEHEIQHVKQQKGSSLYAVYFLIRYVLSKEFRFRAELEAYRVQWRYIKSIRGHRLVNDEILRILSKELVGPLYNIDMSWQRARIMISDP